MQAILKRILPGSRKIETSPSPDGVLLQPSILNRQSSFRGTFQGLEKGSTIIKQDCQPRPREPSNLLHLLICSGLKPPIQV